MPQPVTCIVLEPLKQAYSVKVSLNRGFGALGARHANRYIDSGFPEIQHGFLSDDRGKGMH